MGYALYTLSDGREAGYGVEATCDQPGCDEEIDRGLAYLCGIDPGTEEGLGCGGYFCGEHLYIGPAGWSGGMCVACSKLPRCEVCDVQLDRESWDMAAYHCLNDCDLPDDRKTA